MENKKNNIVNKNITRPNYEDYVQPNLDKIKVWKVDGATNEQISKALGISNSTFKKYIKLHPELADVIRFSKVQIIADLENNLYKRALGQIVETVEEITEERVYNEEKRTFEMIVTRIQRKIIKNRGSDTLLIFALKNLTKDTGKWLDAKLMDLLAAAGHGTEEITKITEALNNMGLIRQRKEEEIIEDTNEKVET